MKRHTIALALIGLLILAGVGTALAQNPNPGVIPNTGHTYAELSARWWQWAYSFPEKKVPFYNTGGRVDLAAHQLGPVWFLAGAGGPAGGGPVTRSGDVPAGTSLFLPLATYLDDYPCPDPNFGPAHGQPLEQFLWKDANAVLDWVLPPETAFGFAELDGVPLIDGVPLSKLSPYRATSRLFQFTADRKLQEYDACITGEPQYGVSVGYWLLLAPLTPGTYTLHFGAKPDPNDDRGFSQDITYILTVR